MCVENATISSWSDYASVVSAITALVAVFGGLILQWMIAKRQAADNISVKRQNWIDELRAESAKYLTLCGRIEELRRPNPNNSEADEKIRYADFMTANVEAKELGIRIKLRLNPSEAVHKEFTQSLKNLADACPNPTPTESEDDRKQLIQKYHQCEQDVISCLQKILKMEWERVKSGN